MKYERNNKWHHLKNGGGGGLKTKLNVLCLTSAFVIELKKLFKDFNTVFMYLYELYKYIKEPKHPILKIKRSIVKPFEKWEIPLQDLFETSPLYYRSILSTAQPPSFLNLSPYQNYFKRKLKYVFVQLF